MTVQTSENPLVVCLEAKEPPDVFFAFPSYPICIRLKFGVWESEGVSPNLKGSTATDLARTGKRNEGSCG